MIVDLDAQTRIRGTEKCWQLERETIHKGQAKWKTIGYFAKFKQAVAAAADREIRTADAHGVSEAIAAVEAVMEKYEGILDAYDTTRYDEKG